MISLLLSLSLAHASSSWTSTTDPKELDATLPRKKPRNGQAITASDLDDTYVHPCYLPSEEMTEDRVGKPTEYRPVVLLKNAAGPRAWVCLQSNDGLKLGPPVVITKFSSLASVPLKDYASAPVDVTTRNQSF